MPQVASSTTDTPMSPLARRLTLLALVLVAALFVRLGFWQLGRLGERRAANRAAAQARAEPPRELGVGADRRPEELNEHWVEASGAFDHSHEVAASPTTDEAGLAALHQISLLTMYQQLI